MSVPPSKDGETIVPVVRGDALPARAAFVENMLFADERVGLRTDTHKYVRWAYGKEELYDLVNDPLERRDLAADERLAAPFREECARIDGPPKGPPFDASTASFDDRTRAAMQALGYVH